MHTSQDITVSLSKDINVCFAERREELGISNQGDVNPDCETKTRCDSALSRLSPEDCHHIWEEVKCNNKIDKLSNSFEDAARMLLLQLQEDSLSKTDKSTILNFLCQSGAVKIKMTTSRHCVHQNSTRPAEKIPPSHGHTANSFVSSDDVQQNRSLTRPAEKIAPSHGHTANSFVSHDDQQPTPRHCVQQNKPAEKVAPSHGHSANSFVSHDDQQATHNSTSSGGQEKQQHAGCKRRMSSPNKEDDQSPPSKKIVPNTQRPDSSPRESVSTLVRSISNRRFNLAKPIKVASDSANQWDESSNDYNLSPNEISEDLVTPGDTSLLTNQEHSSNRCTHPSTNQNTGMPMDPDTLKKAVTNLCKDIHLQSSCKVTEKSKVYSDMKDRPNYKTTSSQGNSNLHQNTKSSDTKLEQYSTHYAVSQGKYERTESSSDFTSHVQIKEEPVELKSSHVELRPLEVKPCHVELHHQKLKSCHVELRPLEVKPCHVDEADVNSESDINSCESENEVKFEESISLPRQSDIMHFKNHGNTPQVHRYGNTSQVHHQGNATQGHHHGNVSHGHHQGNTTQGHHHGNASQGHHQDNTAQGHHHGNTAQVHHHGNTAQVHHHGNASQVPHHGNTAQLHHHGNTAQVQRDFMSQREKSNIGPQEVNNDFITGQKVNNAVHQRDINFIYQRQQVNAGPHQGANNFIDQRQKDTIGPNPGNMNFIDQRQKVKIGQQQGNINFIDQRQKVSIGPHKGNINFNDQSSQKPSTSSQYNSTNMERFQFDQSISESDENPTSCPDSYTLAINRYLNQNTEESHDLDLNDPDILIIHTEDGNVNKIYQCPECGEQYKRKAELEQHMEKHAQDNMYQCNICDMKILWKTSYERHIKEHFQELFYCQYCEQTFDSKETLETHTKTHTKDKRLFRCEVCGVQTMWKSSLNRHMKLHTGEEVYGCQYCGKSFQTKDILERHIRCHTGERPFKCDICNKAFTQKSGLKCHMQIHAAIAPVEPRKKYNIIR